MIQIQRLGLLNTQNTRHVQIEQGYFLVVDLGICFCFASFAGLRLALLPGKTNVRFLVELFDEFAVERVPGVGFGVEDVLRAEGALVPHFLVAVDVIACGWIRVVFWFGLVCGHTHVVVAVVVLDGKGYFSEGAEFAEFPGFVVRVVAGELARSHNEVNYRSLQNVNRTDTARHQIQNRHSDQLPIQPVALMPGTKLLLFRVRAGRRAFDTGAQEALEILGFPSGDVFLVDFGLVLEEEVESVDVSIESLLSC